MMDSEAPPANTLENDDEEDDELFYFESDHLALKGNKDYSEVLKTIFILESQRATAIKDYEAVVELHKQALDNPELFLEKIKNGESLGVPNLQIVAEVPNIHWSKYKVTLPEEGLKFVNEQNSLKAENVNFTAQENKLRQNLDTHNKPWTTEEQKRLEELLIIHPPEAIEFRRFKKIAAALGNRTVKQVTSRVQKYFLKLYKAGLPIPGRMPKYAERTKKSKLHLHQRNNHYLFKPTTFFPHLDVPVVMNESEEIPGPSKDTANPTSFINYLIPSAAQPVVEQAPEEPVNEVDRQLYILHKVKSEKETEDLLQSNYQHHGFECDYCNEDPIIGTRWHCETCRTKSIDFCSDCIISQMYSANPHPLSHKLEPVSYKDAVESINFSDSSSESASGSAFESSNKNFDSSDEESSMNDDFDDTQNSLDSSKYEEEEEDNFKTEDYDENNSEEEDETNDDELYFGENDIKTEGEDNDDENQSFTDTQNVSYDYLHSHLSLDSNDA